MNLLWPSDVIWRQLQGNSCEGYGQIDYMKIISMDSIITGKAKQSRKPPSVIFAVYLSEYEISTLALISSTVFDCSNTKMRWQEKKVRITGFLWKEPFRHRYTLFTPGPLWEILILCIVRLNKLLNSWFDGDLKWDVSNILYFGVNFPTFFHFRLQIHHRISSKIFLQRVSTLRTTSLTGTGIDV